MSTATPNPYNYVPNAEVLAMMGVLQNMFQGNQGGQPRPYQAKPSDIKREFSFAKFPAYDGHHKSLRRYKQEVQLALSTCSPGTEDLVVPHLVTSASQDFRNTWVRTKHDVKDYEGIGRLQKFYVELKTWQEFSRLMNSMTTSLPTSHPSNSTIRKP